MARLRCLGGVAALLLATGCAMHAPTVPTDYRGPVAYLKETGKQVTRSKGELFYVASIDGQGVYSSLDKTRKDSYGRGNDLRLGFLQHTVPARPLRLKLVATHVTAAPIHELGLRATGDFLQAEREVSFTPEPDGDYRVMGRLARDGSEVWIEDAKTSRRVQ